MMPSHVEIVFKQLFEELKAMKQQQWAITNYGVLILAAIYYAGKVQHVPVPQSWLKVLAWLIGVVGSGLLLRIQYHMAGTRLRLDEIEKTYFTLPELRSVGLDGDEINELHEERSRRWQAHVRRGWEFTLALMFVLWIGAILVCLALQPHR